MSAGEKQGDDIAELVAPLRHFLLRRTSSTPEGAASFMLPSASATFPSPSLSTSLSTRGQPGERLEFPSSMEDHPLGQANGGLWTLYTDRRSIWQDLGHDSSVAPPYYQVASSQSVDDTQPMAVPLRYEYLSKGFYTGARIPSTSAGFSGDDPTTSLGSFEGRDEDDVGSPSLFYDEESFPRCLSLDGPASSSLRLPWDCPYSPRQMAPPSLTAAVGSDILHQLRESIRSLVDSSSFCTAGSEIDYPPPEKGDRAIPPRVQCNSQFTRSESCNSQILRNAAQILRDLESDDHQGADFFAAGRSHSDLPPGVHETAQKEPAASHVRAMGTHPKPASISNFQNRRGEHSTNLPNRGGGGSQKRALFTLKVNVPLSTTRKDVIAAFQPFGRLVSATVVCPPECRDEKKEWTATSGFAFVRFCFHEGACAALAALQSSKVHLRGVRVRGAWARTDTECQSLTKKAISREFTKLPAKGRDSEGAVMRDVPDSCVNDELQTVRIRSQEIVDPDRGCHCLSQLAQGDPHHQLVAVRGSRGYDPIWEPSQRVSQHGLPWTSTGPPQDELFLGRCWDQRSHPFVAGHGDYYHHSLDFPASRSAGPITTVCPLPRKKSFSHERSSPMAHCRRTPAYPADATVSPLPRPTTRAIRFPDARVLQEADQEIQCAPTDSLNFDSGKSGF